MSKDKPRSGAVSRIFHQAEVERLKSDVAYWKAKAYEATGPSPSDIQVDCQHDSMSRFLPNKSRVRFTLAADPLRFPQRRRSIEVSIMDGELQVHAIEGKIVILPVAGNVISLKVVG
jgi:hypothetical protein